MLKMLGLGILLMSAVFFLPQNVQSQNKDNKGANVIKATPQDYKTLGQSKEISGTIVSASGKGLTFRIDIPRVVPNAGKKGPSYAKGVKVVVDYKEFELDIDDAVVVKKMYVQAEYDNKGNLKKDEAQSKELRNKGYIAAKVENVKSGNKVKLVLIPAKKADPDIGVGNVPTPRVKTIVMLSEGVPVVQPKTMEKKKKN